MPVLLMACSALAPLVPVCLPPLGLLLCHLLRRGAGVRLRLRLRLRLRPLLRSV